MKPIKTTSCPTNLLFFDTETRGKILKDQPGCTFQYLWFGYAYAMRMEQGYETRKEEIFFKTTNEFWKFVLSRLSKDRPLYCFAHNLPFDLTICDFWDCPYFEKAEVRFTIFEDPPTVISMELKQGVVNFVDTLNYWRTSLANLGESIGIPKGTMPSYSTAYSTWKKYCRQDAIILKESILYLMRFITEYGLGPFAFTQASQAMAAYKARFMKHQIFIHDNYKALVLERKAYHGGLVQNFFIGKVKNKVYKLDVNSLYPSVMLNYFPHKLVSYKESPSVSNLAKWCKEFGLVAQVELSAKKDTYPIRKDGKLLECYGNFTTELCGPELVKAIQSKEIRYCYCAALYSMQPIFVEYVNFFWSKRLEFRNVNKNAVYDNFCKLMMNSLYGKFGQRSYEWVDLTFDNLELLYVLRGVQFPKSYTRNNYKPKGLFLSSEWFPLNLPDPVQIRKLGTIEQMRLPIDEHATSCPIIAAYVTSYARERLRELCKKAGHHNVYYTDTDSLFVNQRGFDNLHKWKEIDGQVLGKLKLEEESIGATFKNPKHYLFNGKETIKGIRKDAIQIDSNSYLQNQFEGLRSILKREPGPYIKIAWIEKRNVHEFNKGTVLSSGWTKPFELNLSFLPK